LLRRARPFSAEAHARPTYEAFISCSHADARTGVPTSIQHAAHLAIIDAETRQQIHGAVTLVLELTPQRSTGRRWLVWHGRLAHADARLLIDTEQGAIGRWAEQQLDDRDGFRCELRVAIVRPRVKDGPGGACAA